MTADVRGLDGRIVIIGAGIAGLMTALHLAPRPVLLVSKGLFGAEGSTLWAQGGLAAARQVQANCGFAKDEDGKGVGPWGKTSVSITLGHNGHTKGVTIPEPFDGKPTGKCAVKAFGNLTFPPWSGPDETIEWPVEIPQPRK